MHAQAALGATHRTISRFLLIGGAALVGCATGGTTDHPVGHPGAPADDRAQAAGKPTAIENDRYGHQGEATMFLTLSLDSLGLSPDQQAAVTKIRADLLATLELLRAAEQRVFAALAEGIAAGAVDQATLAAAIAALGSASAVTNAATPAALDRLHAELTPSRREALVEKLRQHWAFFRDDDAPATQSGRRGQLTAVGLSAAQADAVLARSNTLPTGASMVADPWRIDAHLHRIDAFKADVFDAKTFSVSATASALAAVGEAERTTRFYEAVAPLLTPEQRSNLVQALRQRASRKDARSPGMLALMSAP